MNIDELRNEIDKIDGELAALFEKRMETAKKIAEYKKKNNLTVYDKKRETEILEKLTENASDDMKKYTVELYEKIFELSRLYQEDTINTEV